MNKKYLSLYITTTFTVFALLTPNANAQVLRAKPLTPKQVIKGRGKVVPVDVAKKRRIMVGNDRDRERNLRDYYNKNRKQFKNRKDFLENKREKLKDRFGNKKEEILQKNLEKVSQRLENRLSQLRKRLLARVDAFENIADKTLDRLEAIEEKRGVDLSQTKGDIESARDLLEQARAQIESMTVNTDFESIEDLRNEAKSARSQASEVAKTIKEAHALMRKAVKNVRNSAGRRPRPIKAPVITDSVEE